ncbi:MAG: phosphate ABC transporter permease PstA [Lachnospiraceae bacterium]|nr:phosphate ABC transporter permease PstA [Lachnospiraceae bacterium]
MARKLKDSFVLILICLSAFLSVVLLAGIIIYVFVKGLAVIRWSFLATASSAAKGTVGIAGNIVNTLYIAVLTLVMAVPVGIGAAVWLNEYAGRSRWVRLIEFATETLAGIPSIVFGLFGMVFFGTTLRLGFSVLTGSLTLTLMILPLITRNTQEALRAVPDSYREAAAGMGAARWYMVRTVLIPSAMPGIVTGVLLAVGRIVGESAALLLTAGSGYFLPESGQELLYKIMEPGGTLTIQLYLSMAKAQYDVAFGIAAVLLCIIFFFNLLAELLARKWDLSWKQ